MRKVVPAGLVLSLMIAGCSALTTHATTKTVTTTVYTTRPDPVTTEIAAPQTTKAKPPVYGMRELAAAGPLAFRVEAALVDDFKYPVDSPDKPQGAYLTLYVDVINVSDLPQTYDVKYQKVIDNVGRTFLPSTTRNDGPWVVNINPGNTYAALGGYPLFFDVPADTTAEDYSAVFTTAPVSVPVIIKLKTG